MLIFGLCSTPDDKPSDLSTNVNQNAKKKKNEKRPPMSLKNKMFVFGLCSTSDDWPSDLSIECQLESKKNERRPPMSLKNKMLSFGLLNGPVT